MTKLQDIQTFRAELEAAAVKAPRETRRHDGIEIGGKGHQGDVYVTRIAAKPPAWNVEVKETRQVAVGQGEGSHHRAEGMARVFWPDSKDNAVDQCPVAGFVDKMRSREAAGECLGPIVVADREWCLTHPHHAHHVFPAGIYAITYQLDRRFMRAVRD